MAVLTWLFSQVVVRPLGAAEGPAPLASYTPDLVRRLTRHDPLASSEFGHLAAISKWLVTPGLVRTERRGLATQLPALQPAAARLGESSQLPGWACPRSESNRHWGPF